jgi:hypothetical protein
VRIAGLGALSILGAFALWEKASSHPMLNVRFFQNRAFSSAISSVWLVTFGMYGALFVLTQYLQFSLGYTALQTGIRVLPAAGAVALVAPLSPVLVRLAGSKLTTAAGLLIVAGGLYQISGASKPRPTPAACRRSSTGPWGTRCGTGCCSHWASTRRPSASWPWRSTATRETSPIT